MSQTNYQFSGVHDQVGGQGVIFSFSTPLETRVDGAAFKRVLLNALSNDGSENASRLDPLTVEILSNESMERVTLLEANSTYVLAPK